MPKAFNAEQVLEIAIELEKTGQVFYEVVASGCTRENQRVANLLMRLAAEEEDHLKFFEEMLGELVSSTGHTPTPLLPTQQQYVMEMLNEQIVPDPIAARRKAADCTVAEALDIAIAMERASVAFYTGILLTDANEQDTAVIEKIIAAEKKHEEELLDSLRQLPR